MLLPAKRVGASAEPTPVREADIAAPTVCGPDDRDLLGDLTRDSQGVAAYRVGEQRVVLTAVRPQRLDQTEVASALRTMQRKAGDPTCRSQTSPGRAQVMPLDDLPKQVFGYQWSRQTNAAWTSGVRGYRQVGDFLISVTISQPGLTAPSVGELKRLLQAQATQVGQTPGTKDVNACKALPAATARSLLGCRPFKDP